MSNFNEYFKNKGAKMLVEKFYEGADIYNNDYKINHFYWKILDEPLQPASYYIENGLTASYKVSIEYTINDEDDVRLTEFEIPREVEGCFIIEGNYRVPTNKLNQDFDCRIKMSGTGDKIIKFDYDRQYMIDSQVLRIKKNDYTQKYGLGNKIVDIKVENIDSIEGDEREAYLKLSEEQQKKFMIKLDLDYTPEYISAQLIKDCLNYGDDRMRDLIIDKRIDSVANNFMNYIFKENNRKNFYGAKKRITSYFGKYGKLQDETTAITNLALRFFKGSSESKGDSGLQVPPGVNAINLAAIGEKITLGKTVAYNKTMADIVDIVDTPINQNTNLQNAMTVSAHLTDEGLYFDVYDKNFTKICIKYIDYLNHKVVASEYVDYKEMKLKPNENGEVEVKHRMRRKMVKVEDIDLIDLHPDYRLSSTTRRLPFINYTDSVRLSMGTSMLKQSIPLPNAQKALVDTGRSEELHNNVLNEKFRYPEGGKVIKIDEKNIIIQLANKEKTEITIPRRAAIQSINDVSVYTEPKVKVGQKVKQGDIILGTPEVREDTYKAGLNTLVLFHAYEGKVNEDALVISQSYANRMESFSIIDLILDIKTTGAIKWIAPIGTRVKSRDSVMTIYKTHNLDDVNRAVNEKLGGIFGNDEEDISKYITEDYLQVPNNIDEAYVSDVLIQKHMNPRIPKSAKKPDYTFSNTSDAVIEEYERTKDRKSIYDRFPEYVAADRLNPIELDYKDYKVAYTVRIRIIKRTIAMEGSKITNRYGGKGVVSTVVPDELMPIMVDKNTGKQYRVEVVMNPYSTINRKIAGVLLESNLGYIAHKIYELVDKYKSTKTGRDKIMPLVNRYYDNRYKDMDVEDFIKLHDTKPIEEVYYFHVGCYSDYTPEKIDEWMSELGIESQSDILMPVTQLTDLTELKETLSDEEYQKVVKSMEGKFKKVDKKLQCGWLTLEQLYHIPSYSNKVFSSLFGNEIDPRRDEPTLGKGRYRKGAGQSIGEMELSVLISRGNKGYVKAARKDTEKEDNQTFLNNLLGLGLTVSDDKGYRQGGSSYKDNLNRLKTKFKLKGQKR